MLKCCDSLRICRCNLLMMYLLISEVLVKVLCDVDVLHSYPFHYDVLCDADVFQDFEVLARYNFADIFQMYV